MLIDFFREHVGQDVAPFERREFGWHCFIGGLICFVVFIWRDSWV